MILSLAKKTGAGRHLTFFFFLVSSILLPSLFSLSVGIYERLDENIMVKVVAVGRHWKDEVASLFL